MDWKLTGGDTTCGCQSIGQLYIEQLLQPSVVSATDGVFFLLAIDNQLFVFHDQDSCIKLFHNKIDDVALLPGGFVAVGEEGGTVTVGVIDVMNSGEINFKEKQRCNLVPEMKRQKTTFVKTCFSSCGEPDSTVNLMCLTSGGFLLVFTNIRLLNGDMDLTSVKVHTAQTNHSRAQDIVAWGLEIYTVGSGDFCINKFSLENGQLTMLDKIDLEGSPDMIMVSAVSNGFALISLDSNGTFRLIDTFMMICLETWQVEGCVEARVVEHRNNSSSFEASNLKLLTLDAMRGKAILLSLPDLKPVFEQDVGKNVRLGKAQPHQEDIYITQWKQMEDEDGAETTVFYRCYAEIDPEKMVLRLIAKKKFLEAQELVRLHNLNYNLIPHIVQEKMTQAPTTLSEAQSLLDSCVKEIKTSINDPFKIQVQIKLMNIKRRFDAYRLVRGEEGYSASEWETFQHENVYNLFCQELLIDARKAFSLWKILKMELQGDYRSGMLAQILNHLPVAVDWRLIVDWIHHGVDSWILFRDSGSLKSVVDWTEAQIAKLEINNHAGWTKDAIEMCDAIATRLKQIFLGRPCEQAIDDSKGELLARLQIKKDLLAQLYELKTNFNFSLSLQCLKQMSKAGVVHRMLDPVMVVDLLPGKLKQVMPYIKKNRLNSDNILAIYVKELVQNGAQPGCSYTSSGWEEKVKAILDLISDPKEKVAGALGLLEHCTLPVNKTLESVIKNIIATVDSKLTENLTKKWNLVEANNLLIKYDIRLTNISASQVKKAAQLMVARCGESCMTDAKKFLSAYQLDMGAQLGCLYCRNLLKGKQFQRLESYLKSETQSVAKESCLHIIGLAENFTNDILWEAEKERRLLYFEGAVSVWPLLQILEKDILKLQQYSERVKRLKYAWDLEVYFNICVGNINIFGTDAAVNLFQQHVGSLSKRKLFSLSELLELSVGQAITGLLTIAMETATKQTYQELFRHLIAILNQHNRPLKSDLFDLMFDQLNHAGETVTVSYTLLRHIAKDCHIDLLPKVLLLCSFLTLVEYALRVSQENTDFQVSHMNSLVSEFAWEEEQFTEKVPNLRADVVLDEILGGLLQTIPKEDISQNNNESLTLPTLSPSLDYLHSCGHDILAYLATTFINYSQHTKDSEQAVNVSEMVVKYSETLLTKVLSSHPVNMALGFGLLTFHSPRRGFQLVQSAIRSSGTNYKKLKQVAFVALLTATFRGDENLIASSEKLVCRAKWGNRLRKIGLEFSEFKGAHPSLVDKMIKTARCDVDVLLEFYKDLSLDMTNFQQKLRLLLNCHMESFAHLNFPDSAAQKAKETLNAMAPKDQLPSLLPLVRKTSSYDYEILEFLLQRIMERDNQHNEDLKKQQFSEQLELLRYLHRYPRTGPPGEVEMQWAKTVQDGECEEMPILPPRSSNRLPFHSLWDIKTRWQIIKSELSLVTLDRWIQMASLLEVNVDELIRATATSMVQVYTSQPVTGDGLSEDFLQLQANMTKVLSKYQEKKKAVMFCNWVVNELKRVDEKEMVWHGALKFASLWLQEMADSGSDVEEATKMVAKLKQKLTLTSTKCELWRLGLDTSPELRGVMGNPTELIAQVYNLPGVLDTPGGPDINALVEKLAELNNVDLDSTLNFLLDRWLLGVGSDADIDQTLTFDIDVSLGTENDEENLKRAIYVLKSKKQRPNCVSHLMNIVRNMSLSIFSRRFALQCVVTVLDEEEVKSLTSTSLTYLKQELQTLKHLCEMESLGVSMTTEEFTQANKLMLIRNIMNSHRLKKEAVDFVVEMALTYEVDNNDLWTDIINHMIKMGWMENLQYVVCRLNSFEKLRSLPAYNQALLLSHDIL